MQRTECLVKIRAVVRVWHEGNTEGKCLKQVYRKIRHLSDGRQSSFEPSVNHKTQICMASSDRAFIKSYNRLVWKPSAEGDTDYPKQSGILNNKPLLH